MPASRANSHEIRYAVTLSGVIALRMMGLFLILPVFMLLAVEVPGYTPLAAGVAMGIYGLTQAALQQPFGWLSDRWGRRPVLLLGLALQMEWSLDLLKVLMILAFILATNPTASHSMAKAALHGGQRPLAEKLAEDDPSKV